MKFLSRLLKRNKAENIKSTDDLMSLADECVQLITADRERFKDSNVVNIDTDIEGKKDTARALVDMFSEQAQKISLEYNTDPAVADVQTTYERLVFLRDAYVKNMLKLEIVG